MSLSDQPTSRGGPVATLVDVGVEYATPAGPVVALSGVSAEFAPASSTAILGRSGSGKSSLVGVLALLRRPTTGDLTVAGRSLRATSERELAALRGSSIGTVFQRFHLNDAATAIENVLMPWYFTGGSSRRAALRQAGIVLERMGIDDLAERRASSMSGGQRQRVAIARALFRDPPLLVADEPTGNLDEETAHQVAHDLFGLPQRSGTTVVIVTHDQLIADLADRTVTLAHGRVASIAQAIR